MRVPLYRSPKAGATPLPRVRVFTSYILYMIMRTRQLISQGFACALLFGPCLSCGSSHRQQARVEHTEQSSHHQADTRTYRTFALDSTELEVSEELRLIPLACDSLPPTPLRSLLPAEKGWSLHYHSRQVARHQGSRQEASDELQQTKQAKHQEQLDLSTKSSKSGLRQLLLELTLSLCLLLGVGYIYRRTQR